MTITEVSTFFDISPNTLRHYERIGLIPKVNRAKSGIRDYTQEDLRWIEFARCMRSAGVPTKALIAYVVFSQQGDSTLEVRKQFLTEQLDRFLEEKRGMEKIIELLNHKIEHGEQAIAVAEKLNTR